MSVLGFRRRCASAIAACLFLVVSVPLFAQTSYSSLWAEMEGFWTLNSPESLSVKIDVFESRLAEAHPRLADREFQSLQAVLSIHQRQLALVKERKAAASFTTTSNLVGAAVGVALLGVGGYFFWNTYGDYQEYGKAKTSAEAVKWRHATNEAMTIGIIVTAGGVGCIGIGFVVPILTGNASKMKLAEIKLSQLKADVAALKK